MAMEHSKVSFTVRRPTPVSRTTSTGHDSDSSSFKVPALPRHLASVNDSAPGSPLRSEDGSRYVDSSEEEDEEQDELVTAFDKFGAQRCVLSSSHFAIFDSADIQLTKVAELDRTHRLTEPKKKPQGPLIIPALQNRDWREVARARRQGKELFVPRSAAARTGADGSAGGLGTRDVINAGPQLQGLQVRARAVTEVADGDGMVVESTYAPQSEDPKEEESEDQLAIRALLAGPDVESKELAAIPLKPTEDDAYRQDVGALPEESTLEDYERVPVEQFGAALLRGMGWKEGTAASRMRRGPVEPWLPTARPALLGIGAKEREVFDDGSKKSKRSARPERRYVPVVRRGEDGGGAREDRLSRRRPSRSPEPERHRDQRKEKDREDYEPGRGNYRDRNRYKGRDRDRERDREDRSERDRRRDYERDRERSPRRDRSRRD
jgi:hypothetical protein